MMNEIRIPTEIYDYILKLSEIEGIEPEKFIEKLFIFSINEYYRSNEFYVLWGKLTARERELAEYLCKNYTRDEIAEELVLSRNTVDTHIRNILKKTDLHSSNELATSINEYINNPTVKQYVMI